MIPEISLFPFMVFCILSFILTYTIGQIFVSIFSKKVECLVYFDFLKLIAGLLIIIFFYSIYKTQFFTINIGLGILFACFFYYKRRIQNWYFSFEIFKDNLLKISFKLLLAYLILLVLFFTFLFFKIKNPITQTYYNLVADYVYYATNIENLNLTGIEGVKNNLALLLESQRSIYHFGELWAAAFFTSLFNIQAYCSLTLIVFPLAYLIYCLGIISIFEYLSNKTKKRFFLLSIAFLFICGISFYIPKNTLFTKGDWYDLGVFYHTKIIFCVSIILLAVNFLIRKNYFLLITSILALPVLSTPTAPGVYLGISLFIIILWLKKEISKKDFLIFSIQIILNFTFLIIYVLIISKANITSPSSNNTIHVKSSLFDFNLIYFKTVFNCIAGQTIKIILSNIIYILLGFVILKHIRKLAITNLIIFLLLLNFCGLLAYSIFHKMIDSVQLWVLFYFPTFGILSILILYFLLELKNIISKVVIGGLIIICIYQVNVFAHNKAYDFQITQNVLNEIKKSRKKNIVSLSGKEDFQTIFSKNIDIFQPMSNMKLFIHNYNPISLSSFVIPLSKSNPIIERTEEEIIKSSTFYIYVQRQKEKNTFTNIENSQIQFIKDIQAGFIILSNHAIVSPKLSSMIKNTIIINSHTRFCTLSY